MKSKPELPKDLELKMGSEDERNWTQVKSNAEHQVKEAEFTIKLQRAVADLALEMIKKEQELFSKNQKV
jgi:hypothetical protein